MAIRTMEELLNAVRERVGDDTSDEALSFIEDVQDTINNYENNKNNDGTDWKKKYEDNDKEWRTKYREGSSTVEQNRTMMFQTLHPKD